MNTAARVLRVAVPLALGFAAILWTHDPASAQGRCPRGYDGSCGYCIPNNQYGEPHCPQRGYQYRGRQRYDDGWGGGRQRYDNGWGDRSCPRGYNAHGGRCIPNRNQ